MANGRLSRASFLKVTGLPEDGLFELSPVRNPIDGRWMIRVRAEGRADVLHGPGSLTAYVDQVRESDPELAAQVDACLEELTRRAGARGGAAS